MTEPKQKANILASQCEELSQIPNSSSHTNGNPDSIINEAIRIIKKNTKNLSPHLKLNQLAIKNAKDGSPGEDLITYALLKTISQSKDQ